MTTNRRTVWHEREASTSEYRSCAARRQLRLTTTSTFATSRQKTIGIYRTLARLTHIQFLYSCLISDDTVIITMPQCNTTYVDAAYCYRPSSVVCQSVAVVSPAKTDEPIEMPFCVWTWAGRKHHILDGVQIAPCYGAIFRGKGMPRHA